MLGAANVRAANTLHTYAAGSTGNFSAATWTGGVPGNSPGDMCNDPAVGSPAASTLTLDVNVTIGSIKVNNSGGHTSTFNSDGTHVFTIDGTGISAANQPFGNASVGSIMQNANAGTLTVNPPISLANVTCDIGQNQAGTTTIGGNITAVNAVGLNLRRNGSGALNINGTIGASGSMISITNLSTSANAVTLSHSIGPNAGVTENSSTSGLTLSFANSYTGATTITAGTLTLGIANAIPSGSSVTNNGTLNMAGLNDTIAGLNGGGTVDGSSGTPMLTVGGGNSSGSFSGIIKNSSGTLSLTKTGSGTQIFSGTNTYSGGTTISNGVFLVNGLLGGTAVTGKGGTLGGTGLITSPVTVQSGGTLQPGLGGTDISTLTISNNLSLAGNIVFTLNRTNAQTAAKISGLNTLTFGGTLTATNVGPTLQGGDTFTVFNAAAFANAFNATNLPALTAGLAWSNSVSVNGAITVVSLLPTTNAVVTNLPASNITGTSATLNGQMISTGGQTPTVTLYYGTTDGGTNAANWSSNISMGTQNGNFSSTVFGLSPNTAYYFAASASNSAGVSWDVSSKNFTTVAIYPPVVTNLPATLVFSALATLNGQVLSTGNDAPTVRLYYGMNDGGTNPAAWTNMVSLGAQTGAFSSQVAGLAGNTAYYFNASASNSAGVAWGGPSKTFTTLALTRVPVLTFHYDNTRQGQNTNETLLTLANVNATNFGKLFTSTVDGYVYAQPLIMTNVNIPGQGVHNVVFVTTENNTVYAFDADSNAGANGGLLWKTNLGPPVLYTLVGQKPDGDMSPSNIGIHGTPVIDPATGTMYLDTGIYTNGIYTHLIHALNVATGNEQSYSPVVVAASVPGTASDGNGSVVPFVAQFHSARPALTLAGGILYVAYGSYQDKNSYHGWLIGFNATNLLQLTNYVYNTNPNNTQGALWMGGGGLVVDAGTNLYLETANGTFDVNTGGSDYGDSFVKLATTNKLAVADYFTPYNQLTLKNGDTDLGSGGPMLLPDTAGSAAHPHLLVGAGKFGTIYLLDRDNLGHYNGTDGMNGTDSQIVQPVIGAVGGGGSYAVPAYWNNRIFYTGKTDKVRAFVITNGVIVTTPESTSATTLGAFTGSPVVSASGTNNGIVWATDPGAYSSSGPAVLHAYNATNLAVELYNSSQNLSRDNPGGAVKMTAPVVAGGKVYVGAEMALSVYGLAIFLPAPTISPDGGAFTNSVNVSLADSTPGVSIYYTLDGTAPTSGSTLYSGPFLLASNALVQAVALSSGAVNSAVTGASFINTAAGGSGSGLLGQYWTNTTSVAFTNVTFNTLPTLTRTDAVVNFNWNAAGPDPTIGATNYTVRWTGAVQPQFNETYTFTTVANDGVRLWINGQLLVNDWTTHASTTTNSGTIALNSQQLYNIRLDYFQSTGNASAQLSWSSPSTPQAVVPQSQLYPFTNPPPSIVLTAPTNSATNFTAAASVTVSADADAPYNPISLVSFYANSTFLGSATNLPYTITATGVAAGNYSLTAVAVDGSGLSSTSAPVAITVAAGSGQPYGLTNNGTVSPFFNMPTTFNGAMPTNLSQTGIFSDTPGMTPASGLILYIPNTPLWSDGALKTRYIAIPNNGGLITPSEQITFAPTGTWTFPAGTVFVKTFELNTDTTNPNVRHRLETRLLVRDINGAVYGVTYKWRADNSDADLLTSSLLENIVITNATGMSTQTWYYPSPSDCLQCHTPVANYVLGVNTRQLNNNQTYPSTGVTDNQLRTLNRLGLFNPAFDEAAITNFEKLSALTNLNASLEERSRSYLDANCAQCHQPGGTGITFDARYDTPPAQQNITNYPASVSLGYDNTKIIAPRDVWRSMIWQRMNTTNATYKMPPLARALIDTNAVQVFTDWINSLPGMSALAPPAITPNGGSYVASVSVTLQPPDTNAMIYYTLDSTLPTTNSFRYSGAFNLFKNATVSANAFETNFNNSVAASALFLVQPLYFTSAAFSNNVFQLGFAGATGSNYVLQASTNLINWTPISTNTTATNLFNWFDPNAANYPDRFYRVLQQ
jgi:uncharacterized repeat protein (TIGR03806 family)